MIAVDCVVCAPAELVTVSVYAVVAVGVTLTALPLVTAILPGVITPVPLVNAAVRLLDAPAVIEVGLAENEPIAGTPATVTLVD
jgi:hypothetical protein